jgi:hypothetical protein
MQLSKGGGIHIIDVVAASLKHQKHRGALQNIAPPSSTTQHNNVHHSGSPYLVMTGTANSTYSVIPKPPSRGRLFFCLGL